MTYDLTIPQLRYTKAQFEALNPTPQLGQLCIETDTETYTVGMGAATYLSIRGNASLSAEERTSADDVLYGSQSNEPKKYVATISQGGTTAPMVVSLINKTIEGDVVFERTDAGTYTMTCAGAFPSGKVSSPLMGSPEAFWDFGGEALMYASMERTDDDTLTIYTFDATGTPSDDQIPGTFMIDITVYP